MKKENFNRTIEIKNEIDSLKILLNIVGGLSEPAFKIKNGVAKEEIGLPNYNNIMEIIPFLSLNEKVLIQSIIEFKKIFKENISKRIKELEIEIKNL